MTQAVERYRVRSARFVAVACGSTLLCLTFVSAIPASLAQSPGDGPDLTKPNEMPSIVSTPAGPQPTPKPATNPSGRAVLTLPGITTPTSPRPGTATPPVVSSPSTDTSPGGIQLDAPLEMKGAPRPATPLPRVTPTPAPGRLSRLLVLESPNEEPIPIDGTPSGANSGTKRPATTPRVEPQVATPSPRRGRLFGLFPTPPPAPRLTTNPATASGAATPGRTNLPGRTVVEGPATETTSAAEVALKQRIEKQAREAVGDRARLVDVRLVGKVAVVQARGVKLFQKRAVRKSLEGLPALSGLKSTIEVLD